MIAVALPVDSSAWRASIALALVILLGGCRRTSTNGPSTVDVRRAETQTVATVDERPISLPLFNLIYEAKRSTLPSNVNVDRAAVDLKMTIARQLVDDYLVDRAAARRGVTVTEKQIDAAVAALASTFSTPAAFQRHVAAYPEQAAGVRRTARLQLLRDALLGALPPVSEADTRAYYESHASLYHVPAHLQGLELAILVPAGAPTSATQERRAKAEQILALARQPRASFPALAQHFSEVPSGAGGGAMAPVTAQSVEPAIWQALNRLAPGQVSPVVGRKDGFYIYKLVARQPATDVSFAQARAGIVRTLDTQRRSARISELMQSLRASAQIAYPLERRYAGVLTAEAPSAQLRGLGGGGALPPVIPEGSPVGGGPRP